MSWDVYVWNYDGNLPPAEDALRVWLLDTNEEVAEDAYGHLPPLSDDSQWPRPSEGNGHTGRGPRQDRRPSTRR